MKVRKAVRSDLPYLNEISSNSFTEDTKKLNFFCIFGRDSYEVLVAEDLGNILGYVVILKIEHNFFEIISIAVKPIMRKRGAGTLLLSEVINQFKIDKFCKIFLEVGSKNLIALKMYKKFFFKEDGLRKNYYKNPSDDAILLSL